MKKIRDFDNLVDALNGIKKEGYAYDFSLDTNCLACKDINGKYKAEEFNVDEVIHFEGDDSSPDSRSTLYLISTNTNVKGSLIVSGSIYVDSVKKEILNKLTV
jgi:hypothetical protein